MGERTRKEHLDWAKRRALDYAKKGDAGNAIASFISDLNKHPDLEGHIGIDLGIRLLQAGHLRTTAQLLDSIEGFN